MPKHEFDGQILVLPPIFLEVKKKVEPFPKGVSPAKGYHNGKKHFTFWSDEENTLVTVRYPAEEPVNLDKEVAKLMREIPSIHEFRATLIQEIEEEEEKEGY